MISIIPAQATDLPLIYQLFEDAIDFIRQKGYTGWKEYDKLKLQQDVAEQLLYKVVENDQVAGIFCICYRDPVIWRSMENGTALYLHRLVTNRHWKGAKLFDLVLDWAIAHAKYNDRSLLRMDTWAENDKLIAYYKRYGFRFIESYTTPSTEELPKQHRNLHVALLEYPINHVAAIQNKFLLHVAKVIRVRFMIATAGGADDFGTFSISTETRTPKEIVYHMFDLVQKTVSMMEAGHFKVVPPSSLTFTEEHSRLLRSIDELEKVFNNVSVDEYISKKLLQGPLLDIVTHIGQLAMLSGLHGHKVPAVSYYDLEIE